MIKRFGFAIRTGGDPEIRAALAAGIERGTTSFGASRHLPLKGKAWGSLGDDWEAHSSEAVRRVNMYQHSPEEWEAMIAKARYDYGQDPEPTRIGTMLLTGYAMVCYGLSRLYHLQDRVL